MAGGEVAGLPIPDLGGPLVPCQVQGVGELVATGPVGRAQCGHALEVGCGLGVAGQPGQGGGQRQLRLCVEGRQARDLLQLLNGQGRAVGRGVELAETNLRRDQLASTGSTLTRIFSRNSG